MKTLNVLRKFGQKVRAKLPSFTAFRQAFTRLWITTATKPKASPQSNLYQACNECPLDVFIDCLVDAKLERLVKTGKASQKELAEAWEKIWFEYCDITGNPEYRNMLTLIRDVAYLENKMLTIRLCLQKIIHAPDEKCIAILAKYGYRRKFDHSDTVKFYQDIQMVMNQSKTIEIEILQKRKEIEKQKEAKHGKITAGYFDQMLVTMSKFMGYRLDKKILTVSEYALIGKMMEVEIKNSNKINGRLPKPKN